MKVWVVEESIPYESLGVAGVFTTKEKADAVKPRHWVDQEYTIMDVEEYELDVEVK